MNADVITYGQWMRHGKWYWKDLDFNAIQESIEWVIQQQIDNFDWSSGKSILDPDWYSKIYLYDGVQYDAPGKTLKIGKLIGGPLTLFHYLIISDQPIRDKEHAESILCDAGLVSVDNPAQPSSDSPVL